MLLEVNQKDLELNLKLRFERKVFKWTELYNNEIFYQKFKQILSDIERELWLNSRTDLWMTVVFLRQNYITFYDAELVSQNLYLDVHWAIFCIVFDFAGF